MERDEQEKLKKYSILSQNEFKMVLVSLKSLTILSILVMIIDLSELNFSDYKAARTKINSMK